MSSIEKPISGSFQKSWIFGVDSPITYGRMLVVRYLIHTRGNKDMLENQPIIKLKSAVVSVVDDAVNTLITLRCGSAKDIVLSLRSTDSRIQNFPIQSRFNIDITRR